MQRRRQGVCLGGAKSPKCLATAAQAITFCASPEKVAQRGERRGGGGGGTDPYLFFFRLQTFFKQIFHNGLGVLHS